MTGAAERVTGKSAGGRGRKGGAARQSAARLAAVQALYQSAQSGSRPDVVLEEFLRYRLGESFDTDHDVAPNKSLFTEIFRGVSNRRAELDAMIDASLSEKWTAERLEIILRAILRSGAYELEARANTPARVIISEYVDVAHAFYAGQEPAMVNGVLDRIAHGLRPGEFGAGDGGGD